MRARLGAWLIDSIILAGFQLAVWRVAFALGAVPVNPEAERQIKASPLSLPTVAPYQTNLPLLAVLLAGFVVLSIAYAAFFWARFRGMPGQRLMSLQVGDAATGRNLTLKHAVARAVVAVGVPIAAGAGLFYGVLAFEASVPWSEIINTQTGGPADARIAAWSGALLLAVVAAVGWPVLLLIWTAMSPSRRGLHAGLAGAGVCGQGRAGRGGPGHV